MSKKNIKDGHKVQLICPICSTKKEVTLPPEIIKKNSNLTTISIEKELVCTHQFQAYIDKNFKVRGYQKVDFELKSEKRSKKDPQKRVKRKEDNDLFKGLYMESNYLKYDAKGPIDFAYLINESDREEKRIEGSKIPYGAQQERQIKNKHQKLLSLQKKINSKEEKKFFQDGASYYQELLKTRPRSQKNNLEHEKREKKSKSRTSQLEEKKKDKNIIHLIEKEVKRLYNKEQLEEIANFGYFSK
ncbi:MAG: hypothetical protein GF353_30270 [Candidatus Lokiarchaeota archaeon]|nr:hypothetical protein [Candidatus Lokiarchaeota archaeon]